MKLSSFSIKRICAGIRCRNFRVDSEECSVSDRKGFPTYDDEGNFIKNVDITNPFCPFDNGITNGTENCQRFE